MLLDICRRAVERAAPHRPFPARGRQQPVARPALAADGDGRLPRDARRPLVRRRGARRGPPPGRDRAAQHAQRRRAWCSRSATWPSSTSPSSSLRTEAVDAGELLDDIAVRFAERAARQGVALRTRASGRRRRGPRAELDVELFERAVANLLDNALKFCPPRRHGHARPPRRATRRVEVQRRRRRARASPPPTCRSCSTASIKAGRRRRAGDRRRRPRPRPGDRQAHRRAARRRRRGRERARARHAGRPDRAGGVATASRRAAARVNARTGKLRGHAFGRVARVRVSGAAPAWCRDEKER